MIDQPESNQAAYDGQTVPCPRPIAQPHQNAGISSMPGAALQVGDVRQHLVRGHNVESRRGSGGQVSQVVGYHQADEHRSGGEHDIAVGLEARPESSPAVVEGQLGNGLVEGGMLGSRNHDVVCDTRRLRRLEKRAMLRLGAHLENGELLDAHGVHVEVNAAKVVENEVADGVCALDGECIIVPEVHEPGVLGG